MDKLAKLKHMRMVKQEIKKKCEVLDSEKSGSIPIQKYIEILKTYNILIEPIEQISTMKDCNYNHLTNLLYMHDDDTWYLNIK